VEKARLKCRYWNKNHPFLLLAPFKVEEAHHRPDIFIFHDVLADSEIATIKRLAQPRVGYSDVASTVSPPLKFRRATVQNTDTGELETAHYRISKSAWLKEEEHKYIADVTRRVSDMTGLTMSTAEELQVVNYGIGGHYEPHFDFARVRFSRCFDPPEIDSFRRKKKRTLSRLWEQGIASRRSCFT
jgi:prolyl 4-hydroxylase